jgi:hypothetical protein
MLSQDIGTQIILPIVISRLKEDPFIEGDFYPGDLLMALLKRGSNDNTLVVEIKTIIDLALSKLDEKEISDEIKKDLIETAKKIKV